jgi:hypothetical protein
MKKILTIIIIICIAASKSFSQEKELPVLHQRDSAVPVNVIPVKKVKPVTLSKQQQSTRKYKSSSKGKKTIIKTTSSLTEQKEKQKLEVVLTPEQKIKLKEKEKQPHRGVTNMPNERTIEQ